MTAQAGALHQRRALERRLRRAIFYLLVIVMALPTLFVFYWLVTMSLKFNVDAVAYPPVFAFTPTLENYAASLGRRAFVQYGVNSTIVAFGSTILALVLGLPAAYSIARYRQNVLSYAVLVLRMAPGIIFLLPWYVMFTRYINLRDTYQLLILTHAVQSVPIVIWTMIAFFEDLPAEIEEAARIDGCNVFESFLRVALPLSAPGIVATAILSFIFSWNNFLWSLILSSTHTTTMPVGLLQFMSEQGMNYGGLAAAAMLVTLPVLVLTLFIQRYIINGLSLGGVKG